MGRSIAYTMTPLYHEAISVCQNGSYNDADNQKDKSYRRFFEFLQESFGMIQYLGLSKIPHYTTLQKAAARLTHGILIKMLESFVMYARIRKIFAGINSTGLSHGQASI